MMALKKTAPAPSSFWLTSEEAAQEGFDIQDTVMAPEISPCHSKVTTQTRTAPCPWAVEPSSMNVQQSRQRRRTIWVGKGWGWGSGRWDSLPIAFSLLESL